MPFMLWPRTMPSSGVAYCNAYHGSVPITTISAMPVTAKDEVNINRVPTPNSNRAHASTPR